MAKSQRVSGMQQSDWIEELNRKIWHARISSMLQEFKEERNGIRVPLIIPTERRIVSTKKYKSIFR